MGLGFFHLVPPDRFLTKEQNDVLIIPLTMNGVMVRYKKKTIRNNTLQSSAINQIMLICLMQMIVNLPIIRGIWKSNGFVNTISLGESMSIKLLTGCRMFD